MDMEKKLVGVVMGVAKRNAQVVMVLESICGTVSAHGVKEAVTKIAIHVMGKVKKSVTHAMEEDIRIAHGVGDEDMTIATIATDTARWNAIAVMVKVN